jgi:hypothetical protein
MPNSTTQLVLLFGSKVEIACVLLSLLTRKSNAGAFEDGSTVVSHSIGKQSISRNQYPGIHSVLGYAGESGRQLVPIEEELV